jgi:hypothetical protein
VAKIMKLYEGVSDTQAALDVGAVAPPPPVGVADVTTRRIQETNAGIAYAGRWADASHAGYAGGQVLYSERDGATATYTFFAKSVAWIGPVGSTRGKARVFLDGVDLGVVDLRRSTFKPQVNLFHRSWTRAREHTLTIKVIGSGRPVAIDQFVITR